MTYSKNYNFAPFPGAARTREMDCNDLNPNETSCVKTEKIETQIKIIISDRLANRAVTPEVTVYVRFTISVQYILLLCTTILRVDRQLPLCIWVYRLVEGDSPSLPALFFQ